MDNDVAVFLDLDNLVIGAGEADLTFDINLILEHIKSLTEGRLVLRQAYGDWRQRANLTKALAASGFELQSTVRLSKNSKNLADMQLVVDAMSTLIDRQNFQSYVLISGDRDFAPLVQALRKRGKKVIGVGIRHAVSKTLVSLCDHYVFYDELVDTARQMLEEELESLLARALDQLLQENDFVAASLLKQRMQALSKGAFGRSPQGKRNFRKLLADYPNIAATVQSGTTLFVGRPGSPSPESQDLVHDKETLSEEEIAKLLTRSLEALTAEEPRVRASLLKQHMQEQSNGSFDETLQGDRSFRRFLERHHELVALEQDGTTLYARKPSPIDVQPDHVAVTSSEEALDLLLSALDRLLVDQNRVRASLLKQEMQELSAGTFDETGLGFENFRRFLERYPDAVRTQQKGTTLLVYKPEQAARPADLHVRYRTELKKQGLRVVPAEIRLAIIKGMIQNLANNNEVAWQELAESLAEQTSGPGLEHVSKSYVNDTLRLARRSGVIQVGSGGNLSSAPVKSAVHSGRPFQTAVMLCDFTYLKHIQSLADPFDWEETALALYDTTERMKYLQAVNNRFSGNQ